VKLYTGTVEQFSQDVLTNQMPDKLQKAYETYYYRMANPREVQSWNNSLQFMKVLVCLWRRIFLASALRIGAIVVSFPITASPARPNLRNRAGHYILGGYHIPILGLSA